MSDQSMTFIFPDTLTAEERQKLVQATLDAIEREKRDKKIYEKGLRDGRNGFLGLLGF